MKCNFGESGYSIKKKRPNKYKKLLKIVIHITFKENLSVKLLENLM